MAKVAYRRCLGLALGSFAATVSLAAGVISLSVNGRYRTFHVLNLSVFSASTFDIVSQAINYPFE